MEKTKRSLAKTMSWRIYATVTSMMLVLIFTKNPALAFSFGFIEVFLKLFVYYMHERAWNKISWGQK